MIVILLIVNVCINNLTIIWIIINNCSIIDNLIVFISSISIFSKLLCELNVNACRIFKSCLTFNL